MSILVGLVLIGLNEARKRSNDDRKVAALRPVVLGLREYFNICRQYPATLTGNEDCPDLANQNPARKLSDIIPGVAEMNFNVGDSRFHYASFVAADDPNSTECTHFHAWVDLNSENASLASQKSNVVAPYAYAGQALTDCPGSMGGLMIQSETIFDVFK
jgi:hypothetical protein